MKKNDNTYPALYTWFDNNQLFQGIRRQCVLDKGKISSTFLQTGKFSSDYCSGNGNIIFCIIQFRFETLFQRSYFLLKLLRQQFYSILAGNWKVLSSRISEIATSGTVKDCFVMVLWFPILSTTLAWMLRHAHEWIYSFIFKYMLMRVPSPRAITSASSPTFMVPSHFYLYYRDGLDCGVNSKSIPWIYLKIK